MRHSFILLVVIMAFGCGGARRFATEAQLQKWHYLLDGPVGDAHVKATRERLEWVKPTSPILIHTSQQPHPAFQPVPALRAQEVYLEPERCFATDQSAGRGSNGTKLVVDEPTISDPLRVQEPPSERMEWNWLAVASPIILIIALVAAIPAQSTELLMIGCLAALAAAIIGARQCREKGQKGQGFAMAVMGLAAAGALVALIALLTRL